MRILLTAQADPLNPRAWSGTPRYLAETLRELGLLAGVHSAQAPWPLRLALLAADRLSRDRRGRRAISPDGREQWEIALRTWRIRRRISRIVPGETVGVLSVSSRAPLPWKDSGCFYVDSIIPHWQGTPPWRYSDVASERLARVEREVLQTARHIFTMSEWARAGLVEEYGFAADRVTAVGAGPTHLRPVEDKDPATYAAKRLLFVGLDWERKGGPLLLEALRLARRVDPSITLDIAGASLPIVQDGVRLQGWLGWEELGRLYSSASLFVMPSHQEAWGLVFTEAALCGLASIGLNRWATPEVIEDGVTGRVLEPEPELLAATLLEMLGDPERLQRMGQAAKARAQHWTWRAVVERMLAHF